MSSSKEIAMPNDSVMGFEFNVKNWGLGAHIAVDKRPEFIFYIGIIFGPFEFYLAI